MTNTTPLILSIETATDVCSAVLSRGGELLAAEETSGGNSHSGNLIGFIEKVLNHAGIEKNNLDAVAVSMGPGSYTGLRIGASTAKGLCYSLEKPLIAVSTLESIMQSALQSGLFSDRDYLFCPMIDARRMEVYTTLFDLHGNRVEDVCAKIVDEDTFRDILEKHPVVFCGNGMPKCREILAKNSNAFFSDIPLSAFFMIEIALRKYITGDFEDVAYFEPFYLKDFVAGKPSVKGLS